MTESYIQIRYRTDNTYKKKQLQYSRKYAKEHPEKVNIAQKIRYANRTPEQIQARKEYLKEYKSRKLLNQPNQLIIFLRVLKRKLEELKGDIITNTNDLDYLFQQLNLTRP